MGRCRSRDVGSQHWVQIRSLGLPQRRRRPGPGLMPNIATAFDAHLHPEGLTDTDLESLYFFGIRAALAVAHHGSGKMPRPEELTRHFDDIVERQVNRLERVGIRAYAAIGIHPLRIPRRGLEELLDALPNYFE